MSAAQHAGNSTNGRSIIPASIRAGVGALAAVSPALAGRAAAQLFLTPPRRGRSRREGAALEGTRAFELRHEGRALRGWTLGTGPAVLLVHGWGGRSGQLAPLARALAAAGCTAVAFDAPAHGRSGGRTTSIVGFARAAAAVARHFDARAAIGHSAGAAAIAFALSRGLDLAAAVLVAPPRTPIAFMDELAAALHLSPAARAALDDQVVRRVGARFDEVDVARSAPAAPPPLLVMHDLEDPDVPLASGTSIAHAWRARLVVTSGLGHRRILRDVAVANEIVAFVTAHLARCACGRLAGSHEGDEVPRCGDCALAEELWARERRRARIGNGHLGA